MDVQHEPALSTTAERAMSGENAHFERGIEYLAMVARQLTRGDGRTKADRLVMLRYLNGSLSALHSSVHFGERPTADVFQRAKNLGQCRVDEEIR